MSSILPGTATTSDSFEAVTNIDSDLSPSGSNIAFDEEGYNREQIDPKDPMTATDTDLQNLTDITGPPSDTKLLRSLTVTTLPLPERQPTFRLPKIKHTIPIPKNRDVKYKTINISDQMEMSQYDYQQIQKYTRRENAVFIVGILLLIAAFAIASVVNYTRYKDSQYIDPTYNLFMTLFKIVVTITVMSVSYGMTYYSNRKDDYLIPYLKHAVYYEQSVNPSKLASTW